LSGGAAGQGEYSAAPDRRPPGGAGAAGWLHLRFRPDGVLPERRSGGAQQDGTEAAGGTPGPNPYPG
ncbi:50S ribosomal protein L35, partial [Dysosmobacter welbionis]